MWTSLQQYKLTDLYRQGIFKCEDSAKITIAMNELKLGHKYQ